MSKQKTTKPSQARPAKKPQANQPGDSGLFTWFWRNAAVALALLLIFYVFHSLFSKERRLSELTTQFYQLRAQNPNSPELRSVYDEIMQLQPDVIADTSRFSRMLRGYQWAVNDLAIGNLENIEKVKEEMHANREDSTEKSALEAKMRRRIGLYPLFEYINKTTPPNAVIYIPAGDSAMWNNSKWNFIYEPEWVEYFIYPRLCLVIGKEKEHPDLAKRATHVLIVEGKGYEKLKYDVPVDQRVQEAVLPIDHPPGAEQNPKP